LLLGEPEDLKQELALHTISDLLNEAPISKFHRRAVLISGMGFFTDAYDLFVIGTVAAIVTAQWHLSTTQASWVTGSALLGAVAGAFLFGRIADVLGRKSVYALVAAIMIVGALASAFSPDFLFLVMARFVLGLGIGGDYPVSAVLMSEYSNRRDRGRLVGMVFSMQALGLIVGPLVGLALLSSGVSQALSWRLLLGLGAIPAATVIYLRAKMPESPRFQARVQGEGERAALQVAAFSEGVLDASVVTADAQRRMGLGEFITNPRMLLLLLGTAGTWFLFDYAYYGNTLSLPAILKGVDAHATLEAKLAWTLAIFVVFAVPGYAMAVLRMDRIGHKRLQLIGFTVMAVAFVALGAIARLTATVVPFLLVFGLSYFFVEFGPNTTTFVLPSEVFPVSMRTTGHGIAAGVGKLGAFIGVFLVPQLQKHIGLRGMLIVAAGASVLGFTLSLVLPEPARRSLEDVSGEDDGARTAADDGAPALGRWRGAPALTENHMRG
jgi:MFS family permease